MTGTQLGQLVLALIGVAIVVAIVVWLLNWLYLRSSKERAFVRTGFGGQKVVMNGGALVLPIVHEVIPVNMNTLRLEVSRGRERALITKDRMRVDVTSEFYVRVQASADAIAAAWFLNKSGTRMLAAAAGQRGVPVYVLAGREKFTAPDVAARLELRSGTAVEVWSDPPLGIAIKNPYFERIPLELVAAIISDVGALGPDHVAEMA